MSANIQGEKPMLLEIPRVDEGYFYVAEEVSNYLGLQFRELFALYRQLRVRCLTENQRALMYAHYKRESLKRAPVRMLAAKEVDDILESIAAQHEAKLKAIVAYKRKIDEHKLEQEPEEKLAPIRLDIVIDGVAYVDTFVLNINEPCFTPYMYAQMLCRERDLSEKFVDAIEIAICDQVEIFNKVYGYMRQLKNTLMEVEFDIEMCNQHYKERIEWYIGNDEITPETYAQRLCGELCLHPDIADRIAFDIREQILWTVIKYRVSLNTEQSNA